MAEFDVEACRQNALSIKRKPLIPHQNMPIATACNINDLQRFWCRRFYAFFRFSGVTAFARFPRR